MKKVLFATTALVASAGIASAQGVSLSGSAEMGIIGGSKYGDVIQFFTDVDVTFKFSGETDGGLTFGGSIDLDESEGTTAPPSPAFAGTTQGGETVFISGNFGTITMGDTDGALDWALTEAIIGGSLNDDHEHAGYNGNSRGDGMYDGQIARYNYSFGDFAFAASVELDDTGVGDPVFGIGGKYSASLGGVDLGIGLGFQDYASDDMWGISVDAKFAGGFQVIVNYSDLGDSDGGGVDETHVGVAVGYTMDALTIAANWGQFEEGASTQDGYGLVVNYDLGGGAVVQFGYGDSTCGVYAGCTAGDSFSLGVAMSF